MSNYAQSGGIDALRNDLAGVGSLVTVAIVTGPNNGMATVVGGTRHILYTREQALLVWRR